jgi:hypothetical protein
MFKCLQLGRELLRLWARATGPGRGDRPVRWRRSGVSSGATCGGQSGGREDHRQGALGGWQADDGRHRRGQSVEFRVANLSPFRREADRIAMKPPPWTNGGGFALSGVSYAVVASPAVVAAMRISIASRTTSERDTDRAAASSSRVAIWSVLTDTMTLGARLTPGVSGTRGMGFTFAPFAAPRADAGSEGPRGWRAAPTGRVSNAPCPALHT